MIAAERPLPRITAGGCAGLERDNREADDFFGTHVNLAARIGGAAQGEEILVSGLLRALTESAGEFTFDPGRDLELKGIAETQRVFAVAWR